MKWELFEASRQAIQLPPSVSDDKTVYDFLGWMIIWTLA